MSGNEGPTRIRTRASIDVESVARFLDAYQPPTMDPTIREELDAFVARRVAEGGVATDY